MKTLICFFFLFAVALSGCDQRVKQVNAAPLADSFTPYAPGEYSVSKIYRDGAPAGLSADVLALAIKAVERHDQEAIASLHEQGLTFNLQPRTKIVLTPVEVSGAQLQTSLIGTIDGINICQGTVESGRRVGTRVIVGCDTLTK